MFTESQTCTEAIIRTKINVAYKSNTTQFVKMNTTKNVKAAALKYIDKCLYLVGKLCAKSQIQRKETN